MLSEALGNRVALGQLTLKQPHVTSAIKWYHDKNRREEEEPRVVRAGLRLQL